MIQARSIVVSRLRRRPWASGQTDSLCAARKTGVATAVRKIGRARKGRERDPFPDGVRDWILRLPSNNSTEKTVLRDYLESIDGRLGIAHGMAVP